MLVIREAYIRGAYILDFTVSQYDIVKFAVVK